VAPFKIDPDTVCTDRNTPAGCRRDIDVLADPALWTVDREQVSVNAMDEGVACAPAPCWDPKRYLLADRDGDDVIDYLYSADFHFLVGPYTDVNTDVTIDVRSERVVGGATVNRSIELHLAAGVRQKLIVTVPLYTRKVHVTVAEVDSMIGRIPVDDDFTNVDYGEDCAFDTSRDPVAVTTCGHP
jgi:hypothetical protein